MRRSLGAAFAGMGGAALLTAAAGNACAQDFVLKPGAVPSPETPISDQWRVAVNPEQSLLHPPENIVSPDRFQANDIYSVQKDFSIGENQRFSLRLDAQRESEGGLAGVVRSGSLPFSRGERVPGEGQWGMRFKKGASIQWSITW